MTINVSYIIGSKNMIVVFDSQNKTLKKVYAFKIGEIHCLEWGKNSNENNKILFLATKSKIYQTKKGDKSLTEVMKPNAMKPILNPNSRLYNSITDNVYKLLDYDFKIDNNSIVFKTSVEKNMANDHKSNNYRYRLKNNGIYFGENYIHGSLNQIRIMPQTFNLNRKAWIKEDLRKALKIDNFVKTKISEELDIKITEKDYHLKIVKKDEEFNQKTMVDTMTITVFVTANNVINNTMDKLTGSFSFDATIIFTAKDLSKIKIADPNPPVLNSAIDVKHDQPTAKLVVNDVNLRVYIYNIIYKELKIATNSYFMWYFAIEVKEPEQILKLDHYNFITLKITAQTNSDKIYGSFKLRQKFIIYNSKDESCCQDRSFLSNV